MATTEVERKAVGYYMKMYAGHCKAPGLAVLQVGLEVEVEGTMETIVTVSVLVTTKFGNNKPFKAPKKIRGWLMAAG
jgi:hypothetical protein